MFPSAPDVKIFATTLIVGRDASAEIVIDAKEPTKVEYVEVKFTGDQGWLIGGGKHSHGVREKYPRLVKRVMGEGVLAAGETRFKVLLGLPTAMPPSHEIAPAWARVDLDVRVAIPWWPDGKYRFRLPVRLPPPGEVVRTPFATRNLAGASDPRIELSLASTRLVAGEHVVGSCAVYHVDDRNPIELDLWLIPSFKLYGEGRAHERRGDTLGITVTLPAGSAGTSVPFKFKLPETLTPSFASVTHELSWWLQARTGSFFRGRLELMVPLEIVDAAALQTTSRLTAPPRLSDARITAAFERFAANHDWKPAPPDDDNGYPAIERDHGAATLRLGYDYRGQAGTFVIARIEPHPPLGLGLSVTKSSPLRELVSRDLEVDLAEWDRAHRVSARSHSQATPFLKATVPAVTAAEQKLGSLLRWTDDELVFERAVIGVEEHDLVESMAALAALAGALEAAPIEPPLVVDVAAWQALAQRLRGRLGLGDLSIEGELDQLPVNVGIEFEEASPRGLRVYVGDPAKASETLRAAQPSAEQLAAWPIDFVQLQVNDGVASAALALPADATRTLELARALRGLIAALDPQPGPYR